MEAIQYLLQQQIDKKKWDARISNADNGLVYACSGYLNSMAPGWDALMLNNYEVVMPLPHRKKFGIHYLFQPSITPSLGIFGNNITAAIADKFMDAIPKKFKVWDLSFNAANKVTFPKGIIIARSNYVLNLNLPYEQLLKNYSQNIQRNITKAIKNGCIIKKEISFNDVAAICKTEFPKFTTVENGLFEKLHEVYTMYSDAIKSYGVFSKEGTLLASAIFLFFKDRAYYWLVGNTAASKQYGASSLLLDSFIKEHAQQNLLLDFEGSDTDSVADFYRRFGAVAEPYSTLYINKLPFPFSLLKPLPQHYRQLISK